MRLHLKLCNCEESTPSLRKSRRRDSLIQLKFNINYNLRGSFTICSKIDQYNSDSNSTFELF